jgi:hypothetical protein
MRTICPPPPFENCFGLRAPIRVSWDCLAGIICFTDKAFAHQPEGSPGSKHEASGAAVQARPILGKSAASVDPRIKSEEVVRPTIQR